MNGRPPHAVEQKVHDIRRAFGPVIGARLRSYSTAEILHDDGTWGAWPDLPVRLEWDSGHLVALAWSKFDDLQILAAASASWAAFDDPWVATDSAAPLTVSGTTARWVADASIAVRQVVGASLLSVALGRGEMSVAGHDIEIWTRVLLETEAGWLEIFNALDENGFAHYRERPPGDLVPCI